jgi:hypothetical protein
MDIINKSNLNEHHKIEEKNKRIIMACLRAHAE